MKNSQKGFVVPLLIAIIAVLVVGGGAFYYFQKQIPKTTQTTTNQHLGDETYADNYVIDQVIVQKITTLPKDCVSISSKINGQAIGTIVYEIREIHNKVCGGDPNTNPLITTAILELPSGQISFSNVDVAAGQGLPVISSIYPASGPIGTKVQIKGKNLAGFESDKDVYFERADGKKIMLTDVTGNYSGDSITVKVTEPCQEGQTIYGRYSGNPELCKYVALTPGIYKVYAEPWSTKSNVVTFTLTK